MTTHSEDTGLIKELADELRLLLMWAHSRGIDTAWAAEIDRLLRRAEDDK